jgi:inorganic pyrophosphatase
MGHNFWRTLETLVASCSLTIDRPKGSPHPRYPTFVYPYDYGYLENTQGGDGSGVDVWVGSLPDKTITAVVCTVDLSKRDAEMKLLVGCTPHEVQEIFVIHDSSPRGAALLIERPGNES